MDEIVTSRVPSEVRRQGSAILKKIGATQTQLVNSAYDYLIQHECLPTDAIEQLPKPGHRTLTPEMREELTRFLSESTVQVPESFWGERTYKDILEAGRRADYASLA